MVNFFNTRDNIFNSIIVVLGVFLMILYPIWVLRTMRKNFSRLEKPSVRAKYGVLYEGLEYKTYYVAMYNVAFMMRSIVVVMIILTLSGHALYQVQLLIFMSTAELCYLFMFMPHDTAKKNWIEIFNASAVMLTVHFT